ncbi:methionine ABC transporter ATP-binding protein [Candidatus Enterococcus murrayae]|uniref:ATP-binding cassette domain-containing protein n=1 Tax=Candidatus Enterococcus murrayae TaxID=2815321 RepID=A0ABS3HLT2_9ENTE|nr:ATP-binding cassette domain-containing protein [Enterococcus sp. MJM16]MBO0454393.1 ATP-binding cassette domain-containing protein [Enterococcus sp. MJM16]
MEIVIDQINKSYGKQTILENISLTIPAGSIMGILGISGAGKSTLLRCINGLEQSQSGSIRIGTQALEKLTEKQLREMKKKIGMIFQGNSLIEQKTIYKNVALPLECSGYSKEAIKERVEELLAEVGIADKAHMKPRQLSGGQKQRAAIARALTMNPEVLLCDEATSALDPNITNGILELLLKLNHKMGLTIVVVTHQMEVVKKICDRVAILQKGKIVEEDTVQQVFLNNSEVLQTITGEQQTDFGELKANHCLVKIVTHLEEDLLAMLRQAGVAAPHLLKATTEQFKEETLTTLIVSVPKEDIEKLLTLAEQGHFICQEVKGRE